MEFLVAVVGLIGLLGIYYFVLRPKYHPLNALSGPQPSHLILGNPEAFMLEWGPTNPFPEPYLSWMTQFGSIYHFRYLIFERISISDPDAIKHVLVTNSCNYHRAPVPRAVLRDFTGGIGLLSSEDPLHASQRKLLHPQFTIENLKSFVPLFEHHGRNFIQHLDTMQDSAIDMQDYLTKLTLDIIGSASFGYEFGALANSNPQLVDAIHSLLQAPSISFILATTFLPGVEHIPLPYIRRRQAAKKIIFSAFDRIMEAKLQRSNPTSKKDLLDLMLQNDAYEMSSEEARVHVMTFMLAGHETISNGLGWVLCMLAQHPDIEERVVQECRDVVSKETPLSWDSISQLKFLTAVIHETLRMFPPVTNLGARINLDEDLIPRSDGPPVKLPRGCGVSIIVSAIHRNPRFWTRPSEFLPDRFMEGSALNESDKLLRDGRGLTYIFMPFSTGAKNCIGNRFAIAEMQILLAVLLDRYQFTLASTADTHVKFTGVTIKAKQLDMIATRR